MAEMDAKVNMSLDEIIKLDRKERKKKSSGNDKKSRQKGKIQKIRQNRLQRDAAGAKGRDTNVKRNLKSLTQNTKKKTQLKRFQQRRRQQQQQQQKQQQPQQSKSDGYLAKQYKQMNIPPKKPQNRFLLNRIAKQQRGIKSKNVALNQVKKNKVGRLIRSRSRNNIAAKNFLTSAGGNFKQINRLSTLRDPNSVHNRLGYQSPTQIAYRNRVKRAKQLLLQRQTQKLLTNMQMNPGKSRLQFALERRQQQLLLTRKSFNSGGMRSDQILRPQSKTPFTQNRMKLNADQMNSNQDVNFMCRLGKNFTISQQPLNPPHTPLPSRNSRHFSRDRVLFQATPHNEQLISRAPIFSQQQRARSRSRSRSRSRPRAVGNLLQADVNDNRRFSEVMYSVSNNLGVTGKTLNDRFSL